MARRKQITLWYRVAEDGPDVFNHISDGWVAESATPEPVSKEQAAAWRNALWVNQRAYLVDSIVRYNKYK